MRSKQGFIKFMMEAGVLTFGDYTLKSGRKAPYFVNTGNYKTGMHISMLGDYYADRIVESREKIDALFGPAYKGITLAAAATGSLYRNHKIDVPFFFDRKEAKDHGEGGTIIGYTPKDGDRIAVIEDVVTAGTQFRASLELLSDIAKLDVVALYISVDRVERGKGLRSAIDELKSEFNVNVYPIITAWDIIDSLPKGNQWRVKMEEYLAMYGADPYAGV